MRGLSEADLEERIAEVKAIKRFGEENLGLEYGNAFQYVDFQMPREFYWLYACQKDRLEWPILGGMAFNRPYIHYKHKSSAQRRAKKLEDEGLDTHIFAGEAMGRSDCPITTSLLEANTIRKASTILHEGFHIYRHKRAVETTPSTIWVVPYHLEEAIASYTGFKGARLYCEKNNPELVDEAECEEEWWLKYAEFINRYHTELKECYERAGNREEILARAKEEGEENHLFHNLQPNNAYFLRMIDYAKSTPLVWEALDGVDLKEYLADPDEIHAYLLEQIGKKPDG